jgi:proteasome lid subunit RPN8/RPN11
VAALAPPQATLADLGVEAAAGPPAGRVGVVLRPHAFKHLTAGPFSSEVETGGFLAGYVFRDQDREGCHLLEVTGAIPAERTGASLLQFTFTGESFLRMSDQLVRRGQRERLVGWYHTHLFPASDALGLSSIDVELHHGTFRLPWQVAGLINLDAQTRVLRFYQERQDDSSTGATMEVVPYWVANGIRRPPAVGADDEG